MPRQSHAAPLQLPEPRASRLPEGSLWSRWDPISGETPAPVAFFVDAPSVGAPACPGCTVSLRSLIYRHIFLSYHTAVTESQWDCSHITHRIVSQGPTTYWTLKAKRKRKTNNSKGIQYYSRDRNRWHFQASYRRSVWWHLRSACLYLTVVSTKTAYLRERWCTLTCSHRGISRSCHTEGGAMGSELRAGDFYYCFTLAKGVSKNYLYSLLYWKHLSEVLIGTDI